MDRVRVFERVPGGFALSRYFQRIRDDAHSPLHVLGHYFGVSPDWLSGSPLNPNISVLKKDDSYSDSFVGQFWENVVDSLVLSRRVVSLTSSHNLESISGENWMVGPFSGVPVFRYSEYDGKLHLHGGIDPYSTFLFSSTSASYRWVLDLFNLTGEYFPDGKVFIPDRQGIERLFWLDVLGSVHFSPALFGAAGYVAAVRSGRSVVEYESQCGLVLEKLASCSWSDVEKLLKR